MLNSVCILLVKVFHKIKILSVNCSSIFRSKRQKELIKNLKNNINALPLLERDKDANATWIKYRTDVREMILEKNIDNFLNWPIIRSSMFHEGEKKELLEIMKINNFDNVWKSALKESKVGNPRSYQYLLSSSGNLIHNAYSLSTIAAEFDINISDLSRIFEFGGGYGSMCRLYFNLGFNGQYVIYDLPEFNYLQEYFLKSVFLNKDIAVYSGGQTKKHQIVLISDKNGLVSQFKEGDDSADVFVATWSISEAPVDVRELVFGAVKNPKYYLIAYRDNFEGVNNVAYFKNFMKIHDNYIWSNKEINHLPGNYFILGKRVDV